MKRRGATFVTSAALLALVTPASPAEVAQKDSVRVSVMAKLSPHALPRSGAAPIAITVGGRIMPTTPSGLPRLEHIVIAINRHGRLDSRGLPVCRIRQIQPSTTRAALQACGGSLVGEGSFSADVRLPGQSPFPSLGKMLAFNGRFQGRPAILAHIYGTDPAPTSYVLPFVVTPRGGTFGTVLKASLPQVTGDWGFVTGVKMTLSRRFRYRGRLRAYLTAGCPAPRGFRSVFFPLVRTSFSFAGDVALATTLTRSCRVG